MARDFWVDHSDPSFPTIKHKSHPDFEESMDDTYTLAGAQLEIKKICRAHRDHWLRVMHQQLSQSREALHAEAVKAKEPQCRDIF